MPFPSLPVLLLLLLLHLHLLRLIVSLSFSLSTAISHLLFSSAAVTAATLRLICADGPKHTGRRSLACSLARAKPGRVKIKSELICHERALRLPFYPPRTLRRISAPPARLDADYIYCRLSLSTPLEEFSLPAASVVSLFMSPNCAR